MNDKDKQELLIAISGYLPYGLKLDILSRDNPNIHSIDQVRYDNVGTYERLIKNEDSKFDIKPYLRPISSMTDEEKKELSKKYVWNIWCGQIQIRYHSQGCWDDETECPTKEYIILFDWLNKHHFDYRTDNEGETMIERGLAFPAPENMY